MSEPRLRRHLLAWTGIAGTAALLLSSGCQKEPSASAAKTTAAPAPVAAAPVAPKPPTREELAVAQFHKIAEPILQARCYDCHGDGSSKGGIAFDDLTPERLAHDPVLWLKVLKNVRSQIMPPPDADNPLTAQEQVALEDWIRTGAFGLNPTQPDPGRVTIHRLNRTEYTNSIKDLLGVEYNAEGEFPHDDSGYGFENVADVLNMSPLLMEKYLSAAQSIIDKAVPKINRVPQVVIAGATDFKYADGKPTVGKTIRGSGLALGIQAIAFPYPSPGSISHTFNVKKAGDYRIVVEQNFRGDFNYLAQVAEITIHLDGKQVSKVERGWIANRNIDETFSVHWEPGEHTVNIELKNLTAPGVTKRSGADNTYNMKGVRLEGPLDPAEWVPPENYARFFTRETVPTDLAARRAYAKELIGAFASKAYRRPAADESVDSLTTIAEKFYAIPGNTFEAGVAQAMVAILASPRFLFRVERPEPTATPAAFANVDEYSLASRLSFFLWSTMPDDELIQLAAAGKLRANLPAQVKRMLDDKRSHEFIEHFTGQWLQSRLVSSVPLNPRAILEREGVTTRMTLTDAMRTAFKQEPEKYFDHIVRENRSIDELLFSDYTFLNETLATAYKVEGVKGPEMRKVTLPADSLRGGGVLTMGSVLMITSNPTRTSPVKRGKWILDNILDAPTPPPPPDVPALEDVKPKSSDHIPTLRETMSIHREDAICASCHNRMDPLGLAFENFSALGLWRTEEFKQPIDASGVTSTGDKFAGATELKQLLLTKHKTEFYRCLTEKLMIYATGRGMDYYDVPTIDKIVADLQANNGAFSSLLMGVINSAPFQQQRTLINPVATAAPATPRLSQ